MHHGTANSSQLNNLDSLIAVITMLRYSGNEKVVAPELESLKPDWITSLTRITRKNAWVVLQRYKT